MKHKHRPCPCGCGDMADECMAPHAWRNPLGAFQIVEPYTPPTVEDLEREDDEDDYDLNMVMDRREAVLMLPIVDTSAASARLMEAP